MKKILLFTLLFSGSLIAQPTLNSNDMISVGYAYTSFDITNVSSANTTLTGANSVWDYSNLVAGTATPYQFLSPAGQPGASNFSASNSCIETTTSQGNTSLAYMITSPTAYSFDGAFTTTVAGETVSQYVPNTDLYRFPFTFNSTFTQPIGGTTTVAGFTYYREGSQTVTCDGFGTLTTSFGTFQNILRIRTVQIYSDSLNANGATIVNNYNIVIYTWVSAASKGIPLLSISSFALDNAPPSLVGSLSAAPALAINEEESLQFSMFPNPTSEIVNIQLPENFTGDFQAEIYSITGHLVHSISSNLKNTSLFQFSTSTLAAGTYFVKLKNVKNTGIQKLIIL